MTRSDHEHPLVSVVIIFRDAGAFLEDAVFSVLEQSYERWELLLVDDGSADGSTEVATREAARDPVRVRYLEHDGHRNLGMSASRNLGIGAAKGTLIAFLDADDVWFPDMLRDQVAALDRHPDAIAVCGPLQWWYSWSGRPGDVRRDRVQGPRWRDQLVPPPELLLRFLENPSETPSALMIRRQVFSDIGTFESEFTGLYEDQVFAAKLALRGPVYVTGVCGYRYRQHPDSACRRATPEESLRARRRFLDWLDGYVRRCGSHAARVGAAIATQRAALTTPVPRITASPSTVARKLTRALPEPAQRWLRARLRRAGPRWRRVRLGDLRCTRPLSADWGFDRGLPVDRYYIERFLADRASDIGGVALEILTPAYTHRFGGGRVQRSEVLSLTPGKGVTVVGDLATGAGLPSDAFDCVILTQTLHLIYDIGAVAQTLYRILKPGGVLLATVPGISQISRFDMAGGGDYWRFTSASAHRLFAEVFPTRYLEVRSHGNVLTAAAFLYGLATEELRSEELRIRDPDYELILTIRAVKPRR